MYSSCRRWGTVVAPTIVYLSKLLAILGTEDAATRLWVWLCSDTGNK